MANVTDLEYYIENRLQSKIDIMVDRCCRAKVKKDSVLINEGSEGEGKSNSSVAEAYYAKQKMKEKYGEDREIHLFFRLEPMIQFAKQTEKKIIIWDEPSLDALKKDAVTEMNRQLERLFMTCRIKRHFFIINLTKFYKFSEYVVVDRALGLVHMYSRKEIEPGKFVYIKKSKLEPLYQTYLSKKKRLYKDLSSFHGKFSEIMEEKFDKMGIFVDNIPNATMDIYNKQKNIAINSIGASKDGMSKKESKLIKENKHLKFRITQLKEIMPITNKIVAKHFGIHLKTMFEWQNYNENSPISLENQGFESSSSDNITTSGLNHHDFDDAHQEEEDMG